MSDDRQLAVLDTQVWIDIYLREAIIPAGNPYTAIFEAFIDDEFVPIYSRPTLDEVTYMLTKSHAVAQHYQIDPQEAQRFVDGIFYSCGEYVEIDGTLRVSSDSKDDCFIETAIKGNAHYLVREDKHFRETAVTEILRANGVRGVFPQQFLKILKERRGT